MRSSLARCALVVALILAVGLPAFAAIERVFIVKNRPPLAQIQIGKMKRKGKKYTGKGKVVLKDGRRIAVKVEQEYDRKRKKSVFKLKST